MQESRGLSLELSLVSTWIQGSWIHGGFMASAGGKEVFPSLIPVLPCFRSPLLLRSWYFCLRLCPGSWGPNLKLCWESSQVLERGASKRPALFLL